MNPRHVCCYCVALRKVEPVVMAEGDPGAPISHGICQPCLRAMMLDLATMPQQAPKLKGGPR